MHLVYSDQGSEENAFHCPPNWGKAWCWELQICWKILGNSNFSLVKFEPFIHFFACWTGCKGGLYSMCISLNFLFSGNPNRSNRDGFRMMQQNPAMVRPRGPRSQAKSVHVKYPKPEILDRKLGYNINMDISHWIFSILISMWNDFNINVLILFQNCDRPWQTAIRSIWLVVEPPLGKIWVNQDDNSQYVEK